MSHFSAVFSLVLALGLMGCCIAQAPAGSPAATPTASLVPSPAKTRGASRTPLSASPSPAPVVSAPQASSPAPTSPSTSSASAPSVEAATPLSSPTGISRSSSPLAGEAPTPTPTADAGSSAASAAGVQKMAIIGAAFLAGASFLV